MSKRWMRIGFVTGMVVWLAGCDRLPSLKPSPERPRKTAAVTRINLTIREARPEASLIELDQYVNQVVLLNVWAAWSLPCREECAVLNRLHEKYRDRGLSIVGVLLDRGEKESAALDFVQAQQLLYPNGWVDNLNVIKPFDTMRVIPTKYMLNRRHELVGTPIEGIASEAELQRRIEELL
ncbi:MAG: TlpA disulfide reductase family protein [Kiritimatiellae bacterium]|nr:TlpA disulfide reductase family protein [Kiritimatiellia bacterium]